MERHREQWSTPARVTASVSVLVAVALSIASISAADDQRSLVALLGAAGTVAVAGGIVARASSVVWVAVAMVGASGALADAPAPPLFAVGLFAMAEGAYWSTEERFARVEDRRVHRDRLVVLGAIAAAALVLGAALRLLARDETTHASGYTIVAALGIVALVVLVVTRARVAQGSTTGR